MALPRARGEALPHAGRACGSRGLPRVAGGRDGASDIATGGTLRAWRVLTMTDVDTNSRLPTVAPPQLEQFRLLVETVRDYAIFLLDREGNVVSWNAGAERIKGYAADEIIGKHFSI